MELFQMIDSGDGRETGDDRDDLMTSGWRGVSVFWMFCVLNIPMNDKLIIWMTTIQFSHIRLYYLTESDIQETHQNNWNELRGGGHQELFQSSILTWERWRTDTYGTTL